VGLRDYYKQFEAVPHEEIAADLRADADERRRTALERVEPLDLSLTTWPEYPPSRIVNAITYVTRRGLHRYPEAHGGALRTELAHRHGVPEPRVVVGDGIAQLMSAAAQALIEPGDELLTPWPGYPLHPIIARRARGVAVPVPGFSADALLRAVNGRTRVVALANPNDPTGELLASGELQRLLEALPERVVVLLDEALRDFVTSEETDAVLALLADFPRLLVFRTFSKAWGLAGLRCGYALGGEGAEPLLEQLEPELGLNELGLAGALETVRHHGALASQRAAAIAVHRDVLTRALADRRVEVAASQANVLWIAAEGLDGAAFADRLARSSVIVRSGALLGDPARVRVTVPHRADDVDRLVRAIDMALVDA